MKVLCCTFTSGPFTQNRLEWFCENALRTDPDIILLTGINNNTIIPLITAFKNYNCKISESKNFFIIFSKLKIKTFKFSKYSNASQGEGLFIITLVFLGEEITCAISNHTKSSQLKCALKNLTTQKWILYCLDSNIENSKDLSINDPLSRGLADHQNVTQKNVIKLKTFDEKNILLNDLEKIGGKNDLIYTSLELKNTSLFGKETFMIGKTKLVFSKRYGILLNFI